MNNSEHALDCICAWCEVARQHAERLAMMKTLATVTRYPTGYFGIDYMGSMFFDSSFDESEIHEKLKQLRIPPNQVKWEERYFDARFNPNDPRSYRTRKFTPIQTQKQ